MNKIASMNKEMANGNQQEGKGEGKGKISALQDDIKNFFEERKRKRSRSSITENNQEENKEDNQSTCVSTNMCHTGTIYVAPKPQARAQVVGLRGGNKKKWFRDPSQKHKKLYRSELKRIVETGYQQQTPLFQNDNLTLKLLFYLRRPNNHFVNNKRTNPVRLQYMHVFPSSCDLDNLCKLFMDSAQGILYSNDKQIKKLSSMMAYMSAAQNDDTIEYSGYVKYRIEIINHVENAVNEFVKEMA
jgi:Holliday junction resolvase RusA-like endonuclease